MAYGMLANSVEATKEASVQFAADARCVDVCLRGLEAGDEAIRVAAAKCVKAAAKRAGVPLALALFGAHRAAGGHGGDRVRGGGHCRRGGPGEHHVDATCSGGLWDFHRLIFAPGANLARDHKTNKTAIREGRGGAARQLLRRQRAASPLAASCLPQLRG